MATKKTSAGKAVKAEDSSSESNSRKYEIVLVLQPELLESAAEKKLKEFEKFLEEQGGNIELKDVWGKQKLAYKIGKHEAGIYAVYNVLLPTAAVREVDEHMRIDKDMIRNITVSLDDGYEYKKYEEVITPKKSAPSEEKSSKDKESKLSHKSSAGTKSDIKDKGKKANAASLDSKLDAILEGDDINI